MKCPKCGSNKIRVKLGTFTDLYICEDCNYETRNYYEVY